MGDSGQRRARAVKITLTVVGILILVPLIVFFVGVGPIDIGPASRDLDDAVFAYRAEGLPWEAKDLQPDPPVAANENAAPLIEAAAPFFDSSSKNWLKDSAAMSKSADAGDYKALSAELAPYGKALDLGAKAVTLKGVDFHYDWDLGPNLLFPQFSTMRSMVTCFCYRARIAASKGDVAGATQNLEYGLKLADFMGQVPGVIAMLVEIAGQAIDFQAYTYCAAIFKDNATGLAELERSLSAYRGRADYLYALRGEAYIGLATLRNFDQYGGLAGLRRMSQGDNSIDSPAPTPAPAKLQRSGQPSGMWARAFLDHYLRYWTKFMEMVGRNSGSPAMSSSKIGGATMLLPLGRWSGWLDQAMLYDFSQADQIVKQEDASRECDLALIEALEIRARTGKMPTA